MCGYAYIDGGDIVEKCIDIDGSVVERKPRVWNKDKGDKGEWEQKKISFQDFFGASEGTKSMHPKDNPATIEERYKAMGHVHDKEKIHHGCGHMSEFNTWPICELPITVGDVN